MNHKTDHLTKEECEEIAGYQHTYNLNAALTMHSRLALALSCSTCRTTYNEILWSSSPKVCDQCSRPGAIEIRLKVEWPELVKKPDDVLRQKTLCIVCADPFACAAEEGVTSWEKNLDYKEQSL